MGDLVLDEYAQSVVLAAGENGTDDKRDRNVLYAKQCPMHQNCSANSWARARPWSYDDPQGAILSTKQHLMKSSLHSLNEEEADVICNNITIENYLDMWKDRQESQQHYREAVAKDQAREADASLSVS